MDPAPGREVEGEDVVRGADEDVVLRGGGDTLQELEDADGQQGGAGEDADAVGPCVFGVGGDMGRVWRSGGRTGAVGEDEACSGTGRATTRTSRSGCTARRASTSCAGSSPALTGCARSAPGTRSPTSPTRPASWSRPRTSPGHRGRRRAAVVRVSGGVSYGVLAERAGPRRLGARDDGLAPAHLGRRRDRDRHPRLGRRDRVAGGGGRRRSRSSAPTASCGPSAAGEPDFDGYGRLARRARRRHPRDARHRADVRRPPGPLHRPALGRRARAPRRAHRRAPTASASSPTGSAARSSRCG